MAKLTYNIITDEVTWNCPTCDHDNSFIFKVEEQLAATLKCKECGAEIPLDPIRHEQFKNMQDVCAKALIEALGWGKGKIYESKN